MRRKLFTIALSAIMVIAMAVPAFAADDGGLGRGMDYRFRSFAGQSGYLNIYTTGAIANGTDVRTWTYQSGSADQHWWVQKDSNGYTMLRAEKGSYQFALNKHSNTNNCHMWTASGNEFDSRVVISSYSTSGSRTISLKNYPSLYLCASGYGDNGENIYWGNATGTARQWFYSDAE